LKVVNERASGDPGSASQGFPFNSTFVGPNGKVIWCQDPNKVRIGAMWCVMIVVADPGTIFDDVTIFEIIDKNDGVGDSGVEVVDRSDRFDRSLHLKVNGVGHVDADLVSDQFRPERPGDGLKGETGEITAQKSGGVASEAAGPVATHFSLSTIRIVVSKSNVGSVFRRLDCQKAVGTNATVTVAKPRDLLLRKIFIEIAIIDDHEVVSGSVHFGEI